MIATVQPSSINATITAPASKSSMQRACAAALLRKGITIIHNPGHSNDDQAALGVIRALGATAEMQADGILRVTSNGVQPVKEEVNCGESGLGIRMFTPIISLSERSITVNGSGSLVTRPMDFFDTVLPQLQVDIKSNNGKLPLVIKGPLQPAAITVDGSLSSQFLTGLLMSYAAAGASDVALHVTGLKSKPYIDLTLKVMEDFGWKVENRNYESFYFPANAVAPKSGELEYTVEGDWSGAAFLLVAGAIAGDIVVKGLDVFSTQADRAVLQALMSCGSRISVQTDKIGIGPAPLKAFHFNATECPDLFPPLVALAAYCDGKTVIEGAQRLTHKESNRALTLQEEFGKLGVQIDLQDDLMIIHGGKGLTGGTTYSHHDHRIAMACAVAGLKAAAAVTIESADAINKSYPDFYQHLQHLGATVSLH
ncbi:MAG: 3-phosphoshikimate 1-carboxyvinyltransferase [Pseudobacter sp.]|uniref:3-phosphoshikimate 1-carboxyvinyltransferase n=1 Tax=Pseudobacter sp. TaxID=2045420 RepID=UPI003F7E46D0